MKFNWTYGITAGVFIVLLIIIISTGLFDGFTFFGIVFYITLYLVGYFYIRNGFIKRQQEADELRANKNKFDYCWGRVNHILRRMPGGQGLQWSKGIGRRSVFKTFYDGIQNKPFRSMIAHLENSQQIVLVIYDIDNDDIVEFITNPHPDYFDNPFLNFKPFSRIGGGMAYEGDRRYLPRGYSPQRGKSRVSINIDDGMDSFEEMSSRLKPEKDTVDKALDTLQKK